MVLSALMLLLTTGLPAVAQPPVRAKAGDPAADAGNSYRLALQALEAQKYEEAVQLIRAALQKVGEENDSLKYRDSVARHRHTYYPYFQWGRARLLQSKSESSIYARRDFLQDSIGRLGQTRHPEAARLLEDAKSDLAFVEEAISLDGSFNAVKTRIEFLGNGERFVEAMRQLADAAGRFRTRDKEIGELRVALHEKQAVVVKRYEQTMVQRLGEVVLADPLAGSDRLVPLLQPALIPAAVVENPAASFQWLQGFIPLWEKHAAAVRGAARLSGKELNATAEAFDASALAALEVGLPAGYRAARHVAQAARLAKLREIAGGSEDVIDLATTLAVVNSATAGAKTCAEAVARPSIANDIRATLESDLSLQKQQVDELNRKIADASKERIALTAPILRAEEALTHGETIGDLAAVTKLKNELLELGSEANFGTLTLRLRARALFAHAIAEATQAFLEGNTPAQAIARCRQPAWRAYGFDPAIETRWANRLSPKILEAFKQIKPQ